MSNFYCQNCGEKSEEFFEMETSQFFKNKKRKAKSKNIFVCARCKDCFQRSEENLENILSSGSRHSLIFGGPGTGKTYTFGKILERLPQNSNVLVITFINNLVNDLKKQLETIPNRNIEVRTLHGFCKNFFLSEIHPCEYFPNLLDIIEKDAFLLGYRFTKKIFEEAFANLKEDSKEMKFFLSRAEYYDSAGHNDTVYKVFSCLREYSEMIPEYSQVIVDEYQDFNYLESELIKLIAKKNRTTIAGDDDQSLYRFKSAYPKFIREVYEDVNAENLFLPFCRRCTSVLVRATNEFILEAKEKGMLKERKKKDFECYWPEKFLDSNKYQYIFLGKFFANTVIAKYIAKKISSIVEEENIKPKKENEPEFLILGPSRRAEFLKDVNNILIKDKKIDQNVFEIDFKKKTEAFSINEGYKFIQKNERSNLGWRIIMYKNPVDSILKKDKEIICKSLNGGLIIDLLPEEYKNKHIKIASGISLPRIENLDDSPNKKIKIKLTTYLGAKGLSANHVFVLGLENGILPQNPRNITDTEVCQFIVLLTRARKSLNILSVNKRFSNRFRKQIDSLSSFVSMMGLLSFFNSVFLTSIQPLSSTFFIISGTI